MSSKAIIIGGSISGNLAASVLAKYFDSVLIIDKDELPKQPKIRLGVPQSTQPHTLLAKGYRLLEQLLSGIGIELETNGALQTDCARDNWLFMGNWQVLSNIAPSDIKSFTCSRPLLEYSIRKLVTKRYSNIRFIKGKVSSLLCKDGEVTGVKLDLYHIRANLILDCSGRRSLAPLWLKEIGFNSPTETIIDSHLSYATCRVKEPKDFNEDWKIMMFSERIGNQQRQGYIGRIENGDWIATLGGYGSDTPPNDSKGFLEFACTLPHFYKRIKKAKMTSPIYRYRNTANRLRHYERINMPESFAVLGDAVCALCPIYGQGITVSALSAIALGDWLSQTRSLAGFQDKLLSKIYFNWIHSTRLDLCLPETTTSSNVDSQPNFLTEFLSWYSERASEIALVDGDLELYNLIVKIMNLTRSPLALYHPNVLFRVLSNERTSQNLLNDLIKAIN